MADSLNPGLRFAADEEVKSIVTLRIESMEDDPLRAAVEVLSLLRLGAIIAPLVEVETLSDEKVYSIDLKQPPGKRVVSVYLPRDNDDGR